MCTRVIFLDSHNFWCYEMAKTEPDLHFGTYLKVMANYEWVWKVTYMYPPLLYHTIRSSLSCLLAFYDIPIFHNFNSQNLLVSIPH